MVRLDEHTLVAKSFVCSPEALPPHLPFSHLHPWQTTTPALVSLQRLLHITARLRALFCCPSSAMFSAQMSYLEIVSCLACFAYSKQAHADVAESCESYFRVLHSMSLELCQYVVAALGFASAFALRPCPFLSPVPLPEETASDIVSRSHAVRTAQAA